MNSQKIGKIAVGIDGHRQSTFDLSHDSECTYNFGVVKPLFVKEMKPHSKLSMKKEDLVLTAPFSNWTYGKMLYETISMGVDRHKIFPLLDSFLSGEPVTAGMSKGEAFTPLSAPSTLAGVLASYQLIGAKLNVWTSSAPAPLGDFSEGLEQVAYDARSGSYNGVQFVPLKLGMTQQEKAASKSYSLFSELTNENPDNATTKLLTVKFNNTSKVTEPTLNPNESSLIFNSGEKAYTWLNLTALNYRIQGNNISKMSVDNKALLPANILAVLNAAFGVGESVQRQVSKAIYVPLSSTEEEIFGWYAVDSKGEKHWTNPMADVVGRDIENTYIPDVITPDSADVVIPMHYVYDGDTYLAFGCFKLSDAGKRFREILKGCEMPTDIGCSRMVNCERLLAWYMAYYEAFGVQSYENISCTPLGRLLNSMRTHVTASFLEPIRVLNQDNDDYREISTYFLLDGYRGGSGKNNHCLPFVMSLFDCWLTDTMDYAALHTNSIVGNLNTSELVPPDSNMLDDYLHKPSFGWSFGKIISPNMGTTWQRVNKNATGSLLTFEATKGVPVQASNAVHDALEAKLLLLRSKWTNRFTVTGHNIQKRLKVLGYGNAVDLFGAHFIGKTSNELDVAQVPAMADTWNEATKQGKELGELGGKSINYDKSRPMKWQTDSGCYWVTMAYVRPVTDYANCVDTEVFDCERSEMFLPDLDGKGMEYTPMSAFFNHTRCISLAGTIDDPALKTFGLVPRDTHRKVTRLVLNGGFDLPSERDRYVTLHLNRFAPLGDFGTRTLEKNRLAEFGQIFLGFEKPLVLGDMPKAGVWTRSPYRYVWLNNLERVFSNSAAYTFSPTDNVPSYGNFNDNFFVFSSDNFIVHSSLYIKYDAPMKPYEVCYDTYEEEKGANGALTKE